MNVRKYNKEDYATLVSWYEGWDLPITPEEYIPQYAIVIENKCMGFLYQLGNTPMYWIEGIISNPEVKQEERKPAISILIGVLEQIAKKQGATMVLSSTPREGLKNMFVNSGFGIAPEQYYHVGRRV